MIASRTLIPLLFSSLSFVTTAPVNSSTSSSVPVASAGPANGDIRVNMGGEMDQCPPMAPRQNQPRDIWDLRQDDFDVLMGIGDSIMAGLHAAVAFDPRLTNETYRKQFPSLENRGLSFVTGGDADTFSLAHGLSRYNPNLKGVSFGTTNFTYCYGPICPADPAALEAPVLGLDAALSGSWTIRRNIDKQLDYLDQQYPIQSKNSSGWKLLVVEIGFNNLCLACIDILRPFAFTADKYEQDMRYLLSELKKRYQRMMVIVTSPFPLGRVHKVIVQDETCQKLRGSSFPGCPCMDKENWNEIPFIDKLADEYRERAQKVVKEVQNAKDPNFGAVYDKGLHETIMDGGKASELLSGWDCFHPSKQSHARFGAGLWGNLPLAEDKKLPWGIAKPPPINCMNPNDRVSYPRN